MAIFLHKDLPTEEPYPKAKARQVAGSKLGNVSITISEVTLQPGGRIPLHIHPGHEEAVLVVEGTVDLVLGDETRTVTAGATLVAPQGVKHGIINNSNRPARIMGCFPTVNVTRQFV